MTAVEQTLITKSWGDILFRIFLCLCLCYCDFGQNFCKIFFEGIWPGLGPINKIPPKIPQNFE